MAEVVKSGGKCWSEGVEVSCPKEKTQTRNMTPKKKKAKESREDRLMRALEEEKKRRKKFSWGS